MVCVGIRLAATALLVTFTTSEAEGSEVLVDELASALASSSTSEKSSCLTALIEYAHTPTAKEARTTPVMALRTLKGSRAR